MKQILVRADDLGYSRGVNYGIMDSVRHGIVRSVGLMPNMPEAKNGFDLIKDLDVCIGQDEVILEIEAQYEKFKEITGRKPGYFEGHAVASDNFFKGLEIVARRHGLHYLGMSFSGPVPFKNSWMASNFGVNDKDYDPFETLKRMALADYDENVVPMMVLHPGYLDAFILKTSSLLKPRTLEVQMTMDPDVKQWLKDNDVQVISYDEVK